MIKYFSLKLLIMLTLLSIATGCSSGITATKTVTPAAMTATVTTTVTETVTLLPPATDNVIFSFAGIGDGNTPPFSVNTSPWILQYGTDFSGTFTVYIEGDSSGKLIDGGVHACELYETYFYNRTGSTLYFRVVSDPPGGGWTLTVLEVP